MHQTPIIQRKPHARDLRNTIEYLLLQSQRHIAVTRSESESLGLKTKLLLILISHFFDISIRRCIEQHHMSRIGIFKTIDAPIDRRAKSRDKERYRIRATLIEDLLQRREPKIDRTLSNLKIFNRKNRTSDRLYLVDRFTYHSELFFRSLASEVQV